MARKKIRSSYRPHDLNEIMSGRVKLDNPERGEGGVTAVAADDEKEKRKEAAKKAGREKAEARVRELIAEEIARVVGGGGAITNEQIGPIVEKALQEHLKELGKERGKVMLPGFDDQEAKKFSLSRMALGMVMQKEGQGSLQKHAPYEHEVFREMAKVHERAAATYTGNLGGFLVPAEVFAQVIEKLRPEIVWKRLGIRELTGLKGPVSIPRKTGVTTPQMVSEGDKGATATDITFDHIDAVPHEVMGLSHMTEKALRECNPSIDAMIAEDIIGEVNLKVGQQILMGQGGGAAKEVKGLLQLPNIQTKATSGSTPTLIYQDQVDMIALLKKAFVTRDGTWNWIFNTDVWSKLAKLADGATGHPFYNLGSGYSNDPLPSRLVGVPWVEDQQLLTSGGVAQQVLMKGSDQIYFEWAPMEIRVSAEHDKNFTNRLVSIRGIKEFDVGSRHEESICVMSDFAI